MSQQQLDLLDRVPLLDSAKAEGQRAGEACLAKAERTDKFDTEGAGKFILGWIRRYGPTPGESLVLAAKEHGYRGKDDRCFGPVFQRLLSDNKVKVLRSDLPRTRGHGTSGGKLYGEVR